MKALVVAKSFEGREVGSIDCIVDSQFVPNNYLVNDGWLVQVDVPANTNKMFCSTEFVNGQWNVIIDEEAVLEFEKLKKIEQIDKKTEQLISQGASFDNQVFSLSISAQTNWHVLKTLQASFSWPVEISTKNSGAYSLAEADLNNFVAAMLGTVKARLDSGRVLKVQVNAAQTKQELDSIVDSRA
jgi:hypothetical protein